jgi:Tfp pilus tip-associated adhesin PilY1
MKQTAIASSVGASASVGASFGKALFWLFVGLFAGVSQSQTQDGFKIAPLPLASDRAMDPNVIYIHDDSTSMRSSHMPQDANNGDGGYMRASAFWNNMYYNPELTYQPPYKHGGGTKLVRYPNSDEMSEFPKICDNGYGANDKCGGTIRTLRGGADGRFTTAYPTGGDLSTTVNNNQVPAYWDYVPGYNSMRDNPDYSTDPLARPEDSEFNYEYWAFRPMPAGNRAYFRTNGMNPTLYARTQAANNTLVNNRACPTIFREQRDGKFYYAGQPVAGVIADGAVAVAKGNEVWQVPDQQGRSGTAHAHCRRSYRVYEPYEAGIMQAYSSTSWYTSAVGRGVVPIGADTTPDNSNVTSSSEEESEDAEAPVNEVFPQFCFAEKKNSMTGKSLVTGSTYCAAEAGCDNPPTSAADDARCSSDDFGFSTRTVSTNGDVVETPVNARDQFITCGEPVPNPSREELGCEYVDEEGVTQNAGVNGGACPDAYDPVKADLDVCLARANATCYQRGFVAGGGFTPNLRGPLTNLAPYFTSTDGCPPVAVDDDGTAIGKTPSTNNLPRARRWCVRATGYNNRNITAGTLGSSQTAALNNNAFVSWTRLSGSGNTVGTGTGVTCYSGRHAIGDSTGKGWYDKDVDGNYKTSTRLVSHFEYKGQIFEQHASGANTSNAGTARGEVKTVCPDGICSNLLGAEQSRKHLVRRFVGDDKNLRIEDTPRRRTVAEEIRNYMNWYSYYRTRNLLAKSGMSLAFANIINTEDTTQPSEAMRGKFIRLGYDTINSASMETDAHGGFSATYSPTSWGGSSTRGPGQNGRSRVYQNTGDSGYGLGVVPFRDVPAGEEVIINGRKEANPYGSGGAYAGQLGSGYAGKPVKRFYDWVNKLEASGNTPLHRALNSAGQYYMTQTPWMEYPNPGYTTDNNNKGKGQEHSCRRSFAILMTDGYSNSRTNRVLPTRYLNNGNVDCALLNQWPIVTRKDSNGRTIKSSHDPNNKILEAQSPFCGEFQRPVANSDAGVRRVRGSLGDVAMFYWGLNLRPNSNPMVTPTKKDPAFWPHMQTFTIGMGVQGRLSDAEVNEFLSRPQNFRYDPNATQSKVPLWTNPTGLDTNYEQVDDLMHAGLNGRGGTIAASDAQEFVDKLTALLTQLAGDAGSDSGYAGGGSRLRGTLLFVAGYNGLDWSGSLTAHKTKTCLRKDGSGREDTAAIRSGECAPGAMIPEPVVWNAAEVLSDELIANRQGENTTRYRNIVTWLNGQGIPFASNNGELARTIDNAVVYSGARGNCPIPRTEADCRLGPAPGKLYAPTMLIDYLRGQRFYEDTSGQTFVGATYYGFRSRASDAETEIIEGQPKMFVKFLGDIVNSTPYVQGNFDHNDAGWGGVPAPFYDPGMKETYGQRAAKKLARGMVDTYVEIPPDATDEEKKELRKEEKERLAIKLQDTTVYIGANDGMLHAFDALTGKEHFAYVPAGLHKKLKLLADPEYNQKHQYFVDGSPFVRDIILDGEWRSVLVGHTGRGGKSFFALDVEDPVNFSAGNVLWEITGDDYDHGKYLGYPVDGEGVITPVDGLARKWGVIFGNGYNSVEQDACLFVVGLEKNPEIKTICVGRRDPRNGLGVPTYGDLDGDGDADVAYAGDALGNFWKFDLVNMQVGNSGLPLLEATSFNDRPQPITAPALPLPMTNGTVQLVVGTGKYFEQTDVETKGDNRVVQSLYGFRDEDPRGGVGSTVRRRDLMERGYANTDQKDDLFCGVLEGNNPSICESMTAWRLASASTSDPAPNGEYPNDFGPDYGITGGKKGYVIDFNAPRMENILVAAQGTIHATRGGIPIAVVPAKITQDDPCSAGPGGGIVEINPISGGWIASAMYQYVKEKSNIFVYPGSYGDEINRDSKYSVSTNTVEGVLVNDTRVTARGFAFYPGSVTCQGDDCKAIDNKRLFDCTQYGGRGGKETMYPPGGEGIIDYKSCGGRSGRQSWRQLR